MVTSFLDKVLVLLVVLVMDMIRAVAQSRPLIRHAFCATRGLMLGMRLAYGLALPLLPCLFFSSSIEALVTASPTTASPNRIYDSSTDDSTEDRKGIRLVSWNLLAPVFSHPKKYAWCAEEHLNWSYRQKLIVSELQQIDADIVCLQEIQSDHWDDFFEHFEDTYEGILQNVTKNHPVTNAILVRKDKFHVLRRESRSRALILVLSSCDNGNNPLYLANVHLQAGMDDDETRIFQLKSLLKRLNTHSSTEQPLPNQAQPPVVVVGDFNMLPTNPVYDWLSGANAEGEQNLVDTGTGLQLKHLKFPTTGKHTEMLPLTDVFKEQPPTLDTGDEDDEIPLIQQTERCIEMTYCGGSRLDYIWTSSSSSRNGQAATEDNKIQSPGSSIHVLRTLVFHPQAFQRNRQKWPSAEHPSDHLPVGFEFTW
jgi:endonuclease/exonuclease/phosphatase family metal-dependent hydrolase